jgi:hypothetical protein
VREELADIAVYLLCRLVLEIDLNAESGGCKSPFYTLPFLLLGYGESRC